MSKILVRIEYDLVISGGYNQRSDRTDVNNVFATKEEAVVWINKHLDDKTKTYNNIKNVKVYFGEVQSEYTVERAWNFTATGENKAKAEKLSSNHGIEI